MPHAELRVVAGPQRGHALPIAPGQQAIFGRSKTCDLRLEDSALSRRHFLISDRGERCQLEDLDSQNGTFLNGRRLRGTQILQHLDLIAAGRHQLAYLLQPLREPTERIEQDTRRCASCDCLLDQSLEALLSPDAIPQPVCAICRQLHPPQEPVDAQTEVSARTLGRFVLHGALGCGAGGMVYKAWDTAEGCWIALKLLAVREVGTLQIQRFLEEARIIARLDHPGIVGCREMGRLDQLLFIALEHIEGGDLEAHLEQGPAPTVAQAVAWGISLCEALSYAHRHGVIHRDLKPANILRCATGALKIIDFGLSRAFDRSGLRLTQSCNFLGTPQYMSPEQIDNVKAVDHRTDLYALGVILYRLLSGTQPFRTDQGHIMHLYQAKLRGDTVPLAQRCPDLPDGLTLTVTRAMAPDPQARHPSADALGAALREACDLPPPG